MSIKSETVLVSITQTWPDGGQWVATTLDTCDLCDEPQEGIGRAMAQAARGILAQQNTGHEALFWLEFFKAMARDEDYAWVTTLRGYVEEWWEQCGDSEVSFAHFMLRKISPGEGK